MRRIHVLLLLAVPVAFMTAFFLAPLAVVVIESLIDPSGNVTLANYWAFFSDPFNWRVLGVTFRIALITTVITAAIGYLLAYFITFGVRSRAVRRFCYILIVTPLFTSAIVRAFGWIVILGRSGIMNDILLGLGLVRRPLQILFTETSVIIALTYILTPFMTLTVAAVLQNIDGSLREASRDLGAGAWTTFTKVTLPLSLPGVVAGSLIVFTLGVSGYVTPSIMSGGRVMVIPMQIFDQYATVFNPHFGAALAVVLLVTVLLVTTVYSQAIEKRWSVR